MISEPYNLLPLDSWRRLFGMNPWHFWGLFANEGAPALRSECMDIVTEYAWQGDQSIGRDDMRHAIMAAEAGIREWAGYWPMPTYSESTVPYPRLGDQYHRRWLAIQGDGRQLGLQLPEAKLIAIGVEAREAIDLDAVLVYSDTNNDNIDDTWTITVTIDPTTTSINQLAVYFTEADRPFGQDVSERWRIQPVAIKVVGTTATIKGRSWLVVKPEVYEDMTEEGLLATDAANFVTELAVYRRYTDPTGTTVDTAQGLLTWENRPCHGWWCNCAGCSSISPATDPAAVATALVRGGIRYPEPGVAYATQAAYNTTSGFWGVLPFTGCWEPDTITLRHLAGVPLGRDNMMDSAWAQVIARYAAAEMGRPICACEAANKEIYIWQFDLATTTAEAEQYQLSQEDLANPIGTRRGHIEAWKWISRKEVVQGFLPG